MRKGIITIGLIFSTILASPFLAIGGIRLYALTQIYKTTEEIPPKETALVLGAAAYPSRLSDMLEDRVDTAIELYEKGKVNTLVMSGGPDEAPAMKEYAVEKGVPGQDIQEDPKGLNTLASIQNLEDKNASIVIVSQKYHLPRALFIAGAKGIEAVGMIADKQEYLEMEKYKDREFLATGKAILDVLLEN